MITLGAQIRAGRALLGWSRQDLATRARLHSNSVAYWEGTPTIVGRHFACERMEATMNAAGVMFFSTPHPGACFRAQSTIFGHDGAPSQHGVLHPRPKTPKKTKGRRQVNVDMSTSSCGAKTRKGTPCSNKPMANLRCRFHGGLSRGPTTESGRLRISMAQKKRWQRWRASNRPPP